MGGGGDRFSTRRQGMQPEREPSDGRPLYVFEQPRHIRLQGAGNSEQFMQQDAVLAYFISIKHGLRDSSTSLHLNNRV
jgi:hypothetical protein